MPGTKTMPPGEDSMRTRHRALVAALAVLALVASHPVHGQSFYAGKTVRIIVGLAAGGGFDTYARAIARHLGRHIPGNPTIVVENMPGAGSLVSANHLYKVAKPDGLTVGHFNGILLLGQVLGAPGVEFDARKFEYVGAAVKEDVACGLTKASGITSLEAWMAAKTPVKLGGVAPGASPDNTARILSAALGLPIQVVTGFRGTSEIRLAAEGGEVAGACWAWDSMRVTWRTGLEAGNVVVVLQAVATPFADLPTVPLAMSLAKTDEARRLIQVGIHHAGAFARPFVLPPATPAERVQTLRRAFEETLKDPAFRAEAERARLGLDPVSADDLEKMVGDLFTLDPALRAKLKAILYN
jgi:tripartite-type tricarboxylate transporter receptor subunit TctC